MKRDFRSRQRLFTAA